MTKADPVIEARKADARSYLTRSGNADLIPVLGLDLGEWKPPEVVNGRAICQFCRKPLRGDGRLSCRRRACTAGPGSREGQP